MLYCKEVIQKTSVLIKVRPFRVLLIWHCWIKSVEITDIKDQMCVCVRVYLHTHVIWHWDVYLTLINNSHILNIHTTYGHKHISNFLLSSEKTSSKYHCVAEPFLDKKVNMFAAGIAWYLVATDSLTVTLYLSKFPVILALLKKWGILKITELFT